MTGFEPPLVSEATALPTEPQPLPYCKPFFVTQDFARGSSVDSVKYCSGIHYPEPLVLFPG